MTKELYLIRGLPGSGKTTLARTLADEIYEADSFFMVYRSPKTGKLINRHQYDGVYEFDPTKLKEAHEDCRNGVEDAMSWGKEKIAVSNTFTRKWEMEPYYELSKKYNYKVFSLIVENRHEGVNTHNVPEEKISQMEERFEVKLK